MLMEADARAHLSLGQQSLHLCEQQVRITHRRIQILLCSLQKHIWIKDRSGCSTRFNNT